MKKLILALLFFIITVSGCVVPARAQDVFGRGRSTDTTFLNAADFNYGDVITVDTAGGKHFVGSQLTGMPFKLILIAIKHTAGSPMVLHTIYNNSGATITAVDTSEAGSYQFTFSSNVFSGKHTVISDHLILVDEGFQETITGYFIPALPVGTRYTYSNPLQMRAVGPDLTTQLDHEIPSTLLEIKIFN